MKKIIITLSLILVVLLSGCQSSYEDCKDDCISICNERECDKGKCTTWGEGWNTLGECNDECYDECKPK